MDIILYLTTPGTLRPNFICQRCVMRHLRIIRFAVAGRTHGMSTPLIISKFKRGSFQRFPSFKLLLCRQSWMDSAYHLTCGRRHPDVRDLRESCITALRKPTEANLINSISQSCCIRNVWRARRKRAGEKPEIFP